MSQRVPEREHIGGDLDISRLVTGLWQVGDMERDHGPLDPELASSALLDYARAGFDSFDMADHYGSAEIISGRLLARWTRGELPGRKRPTVFTKWCPQPGPMTHEVVRAGVQRSLDRLGVDCIDLLQFHWWSFDHPAYLDALKILAELRQEGLIRHLGVTNFDTAHLRLLIHHGIPIATNQVSFSLLDRRAAGDMSALCLQHGIRLLAYGTLGGGLISERWLGTEETAAATIRDWSKMKYRRFVDAVGGWKALQILLETTARIAERHRVSIANVASRWVLEQPAVAATIIGARLGEREHRENNLNVFDFALDADDHQALERAFANLRMLPGDCGDEYRRPPFLTASGDLSDHLQTLPRAYQATAVDGRSERWQVSSGTYWEPICGYSRAVRIGTRVLVSGTTATHGSEECVCPDDAAGQATFVLDKIAASLAALGASLEDVISTRVYLQDAADCEAVARVHGRYFGHVRPANVLLEVARLIGPYRVEIEAEAITDRSVPT